jgi:hypothetical protein
MDSLSSWPTPHKRQSILNAHGGMQSGLGHVLLLKLDGKECGLQKQYGRQDESNGEKSGEPG